MARASRRRGTLVCAVGVFLALASVGLYTVDLVSHPLYAMLTWFDLKVYVAAGRVVMTNPSALYTQQMLPKFWYTYTPFAALLFAGTAHMSLTQLGWIMVGANAAAL